MKNCIICKIVAGEVPAKKIYEDKNFMAFLDINPITDGHTMLVPKQHFQTIFELPENLNSGLVTAVKKVSQKIKNSQLEPSGFNFGINHMPSAGQEVEHLHLHIIPRKENDGGGSVQTILQKTDLMPLDEVYQKLSSE